ncbi:hypothetical protein D3C73_659440 [compost metagenome]
MLVALMGALSVHKTKKGTTDGGSLSEVVPFLKLHCLLVVCRNVCPADEAAYNVLDYSME